MTKLSDAEVEKLKAELLPDEDLLLQQAEELYRDRFEGKFKRQEEHFPFWQIEVRDYCYLVACLDELQRQERAEQKAGKNIFFVKQGKENVAFKHPRVALAITLRTQKQRIIKQLGFAPLEKRAARAVSSVEEGKAAALAAMDE